jgi:hypothetical protein
LRVLDKLAAGLRVDLPELMMLEHQDTPKNLRAKLQERLKSASDDDVRRLLQLTRIIVP